MKGSGGAFSMFAITERSSGAASAAATSPVITSALAGSTSIPPTTWSISCSRRRSLVDDTEVAAAAPQRPEEIRVSLLVHVEKLAVGGHHLSREHVVDGEPVPAHEKAEPPLSVIPPRPTLAVSPSPVARPRSPVALV